MNFGIVVSQLLENFLFLALPFHREFDVDLVVGLFLFGIVLYQQGLKVAVMFVVGEASDREHSGGVAEGGIRDLSLDPDELDIDKDRNR